MSIKFGIRKTISILTAAAFCIASSPAYTAPLPPLSLAEMYRYASQGNVRALRAATQRGLNIDSTDRYGNTGLCHAIKQNNYTAYNAFRAAGANPRHPCIQNISPRQYQYFMTSSRAAPETVTSREAYKKFDEGEFIISKTTWVVGGLLLAGGITALALSGGGGGGGGGVYIPGGSTTEPEDSLAEEVGTSSPYEPENKPYQPVKYSANNGAETTNKDNFELSNNSKIIVNQDGVDTPTPLVDIINFNDNILEYAKYLQVGMKADDKSSVFNGSASGGAINPKITLGDATIGLAAFNESKATNYGTVKITAQNGTIGMVAGGSSTANNVGEINMTFKGAKDSDSVIGMYADTYSQLINSGTILGNTVADSGATEGPKGSMIGMETRLLGERTSADKSTTTATNRGNITLSATANNVASSANLVGMGSYIDKSFLDGSNLLSRAGYMELNNESGINLTYNITGSGTYTPTNTLKDGTGGIIGMRADANTTATNNGTIGIKVSDGVNDAAAGMQSVHGGKLVNNSSINVSGGSGNYGMLSVRGNGNNAELDNMSPVLTNNGTITVDSTDGYGMASYNGGSLTNAGQITLVQKGTGMQVNNGTITNSAEKEILLQNSGIGMAVKSNASEEGDEEGAASTIEDLSKAVANNHGTITIQNADGAQGIYLENGTANNYGAIDISNDSGVPAGNAAYGIKALKGTVNNNGSITVDVLASQSAESEGGSPTPIDSYGIDAAEANVNNNTGATVTLKNHGYGIVTTSGQVINNGTVLLENGGTAISTANGNITNKNTVKITDNNTSSSIGLTSETGVVSNDGGTINITGGVGSVGIKAGLKATNSGSIAMTGRDHTGIEMTGTGISLTNLSEITITSDKLNTQQGTIYGIKALNADATGNIFNSGTITLNGFTNLNPQDSGYGISIGAGSAVNQYLGEILLNNLYGYGMATEGGSVENFGKITLGYGGYGLYASGAGANAINNSSTISGTGEYKPGTIDITVPSGKTNMNSYGIYATGGAGAQNAGTINIHGGMTNMLSDAYGIYVDSGNGLNSGTININGTKITGMYLTGTGSTGNMQLTNRGVVNMTGEGLVGMQATAGEIVNDTTGIINIGTKDDSGVITTANNSKGMYITGNGSLSNKGTINIYSQNSYGIYDETTNGATITNDGTIRLDGAATGSVAIYTDKGTINNDANGNIVSGLTNTVILETKDGTINNHGTISLEDTAQNSVALKLTGSGSINNKNGGIINVGTKTADPSAANANNVGVLIQKPVKGDGDADEPTPGTFVNEGTINVYTQDSIGIKSEIDDTNYVLTNNGIINIKAGATGSKAMESASGKITNGANGQIIYDIEGNAMEAADGVATNEGTITVNGSNANGMALTGAGSVVNTGTIDVNGDGSSGLYFASTVTSGSSNSGTINLNGANTTAYKFGQSSGSATITGIINLNAASTSVIKDGYTVTNNATVNVNKDTSAFSTTNSTITNSTGGVINVNSDLGIGMEAAQKGTIRNVGGTVNVYKGFGLYGQGDASNAVTLANGNKSTESIINVYGTGTGMILENNGTATNSSVINLASSDDDISESDGIASGPIGISVSGSLAQGINDTGSINVSTDNAAAMKASNGATIINKANSFITNADNATVDSIVGMYVDGTGSAENLGTIKLTGSSVYGMYVNGAGTATNKGTITITETSADASSYGMYAENGGQLVNEGSIEVAAASGVDNSELYGMYATGAGSKITNAAGATIKVNGESMDGSSCVDGEGCGNFIRVENGATFENNGTVTSAVALNYDEMTDGQSSVLAGRASSFIGPEHSGTILASASIVEEGNQKVYKNEDTFVGEDKGIEVDSNSYMFNASKEKNEKGNVDIVMTMKSFNETVKNNEIADFFTQNYDEGNNLDLFSSLKTAATKAAFDKAVAEELGLSMVPSFAKQNLDIIKGLDRHLNSTILGNTDTKEIRAMFNYVYDYRKQDGKDMLSGYEDEAQSAYAIVDRKLNNNFRYGLGISLTKYESDYDNGSSRDEVIAQILAPLVYEEEGLKVLSMPRFGMGWGEYKRRTAGAEYKADTKNYYYGISNEVRKDIDLGIVTLEPTAEFNVLGLYQDSTKEKNGLTVNSSNNLSVEGGIGLYVKKSFSLTDENDLKLRLGGTYYHEFNNPYQAAKARIDGMAGSYHMDSYETQRDRGVITFRMDYKHEEFDFFVEANKFLEEDDGYSMNAGIGYRF